jgi:hypothetical protein
LGFQDEVWWSRVTQPSLHAWAEEGEVMRLIEQTAAKDDPDRKALACYGLLVSCPAAPETLPEQVWLRFVEDRPISAVTTQYLAWCCEKLEKLGKKALLMIWDNASWHISKEVREWMRMHNREVRQSGQGVRIVPCYLPSKSPWLNRIEPHGCMASAMWSSPLDCSRRSNWLTGSVHTLAVIMNTSHYHRKGCLILH